MKLKVVAFRAFGLCPQYLCQLNVDENVPNYEIYRLEHGLISCGLTSAVCFHFPPTLSSIFTPLWLHFLIRFNGFEDQSSAPTRVPASLVLFIQHLKAPDVYYLHGNAAGDVRWALIGPEGGAWCQCNWICRMMPGFLGKTTGKRDLNSCSGQDLELVLEKTDLILLICFGC